MWLLLILIPLFAMISLGMKSYLVMHAPLGPWIGPLFEVACLVLLIPIISKKWFQTHAVITLASASIGGVVGLALGMIVPSFYFLHKTEFMDCLQHPFWFSVAVSGMVLCAGLCAFFIAFLIKDFFIANTRLPFPISTLVYRMISIDQYTHVHRTVWKGIALSSLWNGAIFLVKHFLQSSSFFFMQLNMVPTILSIGFIIGRVTTVPLFLGWINRVLTLRGLQLCYFQDINFKELLVMFCLGMLIARVVYSLMVLAFHHSMHYQELIQNLRFKLHDILQKNSLLLIFALVGLLFSSVVLSWSNITGLESFFIFCMILIISLNVARIVGMVGFVDIDGFVWCIVLPLVYGFSITSSLHILIVALFAALCISMVVDLMFAYKLAALASISYQNIIGYQFVGFCTAVLSSGFFIFKQAQHFDDMSFKFFALNAKALDMIIDYQGLNYPILLCGIVIGLLLIFARQSLLVVVGATLMEPFIAGLLVCASFLSYCVKNKEQLFPLCIGLYAAHVFWLMLWVLL